MHLVYGGEHWLPRVPSRGDSPSEVHTSYTKHRMTVLDTRTLRLPCPPSGRVTARNGLETRPVYQCA